MRPVLLFFLIGVIFITALILIEKDNFLNLINKYFPFQATIIETLPLGPEKKDLIQENKEDFLLPPEEVEIEEESTPEEENSFHPEIILTEIQNNIEEIAERIDSLSQEVDDLIEESQFTVEEIPQADEEEPENKEEAEEDTEKEEIEIGQGVGQELCERVIGIHPLKSMVIINEVAWMGSFSSANDEWIELKNISTAPTDLSGWQLLDKEEQIKTIFKGNLIPPGEFYLLERTNDDSVPNISADLIYTGSLSDSNEALYFFNNNCQLEDEVEANPDWPAGDKSGRLTMERSSDLSWHNYNGQGQNGIFGTPKSENSLPPTPSSGGGGGNGGNENETPTPSLPPPKILISEIQTASQDSVKDEWIELFNPNDSPVDISNFSIQKATSTGTIYKKNFEKENTIPALGYFLIANSQANEDILNLADLKHSSFDLADNNTIFLVSNQEKIENGKDPDIIDKVGLGEAFSPEGNPAPNPKKGQSIERKENQDTDDNSQDFILQSNPTPKEGQAPLKSDATPPIVTFSPFLSIQTNPSFLISWQGEDPIVESEITSGIEGFFLRYSQDKENWSYWPSETEYSQENQYNFQGEDLKTYYFQVKAKDKAGNESGWAEIAIEINTLPVVINEIAWMGTIDSYNNEWIELFNNTNSGINLEGWKILASDGTPNIQLSKIISAKGFYILERTDDTTLPEILADQIYTGDLGNDGENLGLYDNSGNLIDSVDCSSGWFAGDNSTKKTMERKNSQTSGNNSVNWSNSQEPGGTPKQQNSQYAP